MKLEAMYMIHRSKRSPRNEDTAVTRVQKEFKGTGTVKEDDDVRLLEQRWKFAWTLPREGCNYHGTGLRYTSRQTEAATGLQVSMQAFEKIMFLNDNLLFTRRTLPTTNWLVFILKF
jgi:hypothetical protein